MSRRSVGNWLASAGIPTRRRGFPSRIPPRRARRARRGSVPASEIAAHYGVHPAHVYHACQRYDLELVSVRPRLDDDTAGAIRAAYEAGLTYAALAERFGLSRHRIARLAREGRLEARPRYVSNAPVAEILARSDEGESPDAIAGALDVSVGTVSYRIAKQRRGLPTALRPEPLRTALRAGAKVRDLAEESGVSLTVAYRAIGAAHASHLLHREPIDSDELRRGLAEGRSVLELAARWNTTPGMLRRVRARPE